MILLNDEFFERDDVGIDIEDRGYQFGDGVYEVIRVYNGICFKMSDHLERLKYSMGELSISLSYSSKNLESKLKNLVEINELKTGIIYLQVTRGVSSRDHGFPTNPSSILVAYTKKVERPIEEIKHGVNAILAEDIRWKRCDIKSLNLLGSVLSKQKALDKDCFEAIMYRNDIITEGSSTNVFYINNDIIYTHPADNFILNGITRKEIIKILEEIGYDVIEKKFKIEALLNAKEVFISSTTAEIIPINKINKTKINNGKPGKITQNLQKEFNRIIVQ